MTPRACFKQPGDVTTLALLDGTEHVETPAICKIVSIDIVMRLGNSHAGTAEPGNRDGDCEIELGSWVEQLRWALLFDQGRRNGNPDADTRNGDTSVPERPNKSVGNVRCYQVMFVVFDAVKGERVIIVDS